MSSAGTSSGPAWTPDAPRRRDRFALAWRWVRLRGPWLLVLPFLLLARPTSGSLLLGGALLFLGCALRSWAAGHINKRVTLAVTGPYAYLRHPLYAGSLLLGLGAVVAASRLSLYVAVTVFFLVVYARTMRTEDRALEEEFGEAFRHYRARVGSILPRLTPYRPEDSSPEGACRFCPRRWAQNREFEAVLGTVAGMGVLTLKMVFFG